MSDHVGHYRCAKISKKCRAKIKIDSMLKYAQQFGVHNHVEGVVGKAPAKIDKGSKEINAPSIKTNVAPSATSPEPSSDLSFNKDVTTDVELITNNRDVTVMFLKGYKFTKYFTNKFYTR